MNKVQLESSFDGGPEIILFCYCVLCNNYEDSGFNRNVSLSASRNPPPTGTTEKTETDLRS